MAYDVPAHASIGRSLGMSPNATTSAAATPSRSQTRASAAALVTPAALISTSPSTDHVGVALSPTAAADHVAESRRVGAAVP